MLSSRIVSSANISSVFTSSVVARGSVVVDKIGVAVGVPLVFVVGTVGSIPKEVIEVVLVANEDIVTAVLFVVPGAGTDEVINGAAAVEIVCVGAVEVGGTAAIGGTAVWSDCCAGGTALFVSSFLRNLFRLIFSSSILSSEKLFFTPAIFLLQSLVTVSSSLAVSRIQMFIISIFTGSWRSCSSTNFWIFSLYASSCSL